MHRRQPLPVLWSSKPPDNSGRCEVLIGLEGQEDDREQLEWLAIDARLIQQAKGLRSLVLDELHTYRGRQGVDVALLVRRVREAYGQADVIHVGTSAPLCARGSAAGGWSALCADHAPPAAEDLAAATGRPTARVPVVRLGIRLGFGGMFAAP